MAKPDSAHVARSANPDTPIDPVTAALVRDELHHIADAMRLRFARPGSHQRGVSVKECSTGIVNAAGEQLCQSTSPAAALCNALSGYVRGARNQLAARGETLQPGDIILHNDRYGGAAHGPQVALIAPIFHHQKLAGFAVSIAHLIDIGAPHPGSLGLVDAADANAEGLRFAAIKWSQQGQDNQSVRHLLQANLRQPEFITSTIDDQAKVCLLGAQRYAALAHRFGSSQLEQAGAQLLAGSERRMRAAIAELPDGKYRATGYLDGYTSTPDQDLPITVTLSVNADQITVDFSGTAAQIDDRPLNMPLCGTVDVVVWVTLCSALLDADCHSTLNSGVTRPVALIAPPESLVNPSFPAPTIARLSPAARLADTLLKALAMAAPHRAGAGGGAPRALTFHGVRGRARWSHEECFAGASGACCDRDGADAIDALSAKPRDLSIEDLESRLPLRVDRYELRDDACPAGRWRGELGTVREITLLEDAAAAVESDGHRHRPWGLNGGEDGATASIALRRSDGSELEVPPNMPYQRLYSGDRLVVTGSAGGGYGNPRQRQPEFVLADVQDGLMSLEQARYVYAVEITNGRIDHRATAVLRRR